MLAPTGTPLVAVDSGWVEHRSNRLGGMALANGLLVHGPRHWAAAEITRATSAIAVAVSATSGTVRLFNNGEIVLRIEPLSRAMKWKGFDFEIPPVIERDAKYE